jgi:hypothetical protein
MASASRIGSDSMDGLLGRMGRSPAIFRSTVEVVSDTMAIVRQFPVNPANYYYLDQDGIHSLYAQTVANVEVERSVSVEKSVAGKAGVGAKLKNLLLKAIIGTDFEVNAEVSGSRKSMEHSKRVVRVENELAALLKALQDSGDPVFFSRLSDAARKIGNSSAKAFISVEDRFNAPQFQGGAGGRSVIEDGYLVLTKGMGGDYDHRDGYYKNPQIPVLLHAGVDKMRSGCFRGSAHLALHLRGNSGQEVPFRVFGAMTYTSAYFQIKPFAIWS